VSGEAVTRIHCHASAVAIRIGATLSALVAGLRRQRFEDAENREVGGIGREQAAHAARMEDCCEMRIENALVRPRLNWRIQSSV